VSSPTPPRKGRTPSPTGPVIPPKERTLRLRRDLPLILAYFDRDLAEGITPHQALGRVCAFFHYSRSTLWVYTKAHQAGTLDVRPARLDPDQHPPIPLGDPPGHRPCLLCPLPVDERRLVVALLRQHLATNRRGRTEAPDVVVAQRMLRKLLAVHGREPGGYARPLSAELEGTGEDTDDEVKAASTTSSSSSSSSSTSSPSSSSDGSSSSTS
jgi:hypothetical protein